MNFPLVSLLTTSCIIFSLAVSAQGETTLAKIQRTGILRVAIREDAPPLGYLDDNNQLQGYCLDFFALLEKQLAGKLPRNSLSVKLLKSTSGNRFRLVRNNLVDIECGPNTIREDKEQINFSTGFFTTGTQFLVRQANPLDLDSNLANRRLGVISNTSTEEFITQRYPEATLRRYRGVTARIRGIEAVKQKKLDAMISDGILLRAEAQQLGFSSVEYPLVPDQPLTCDRYGMIIPGNDPQWQDFVNSVIDGSEGKALSQEWFGQLANFQEFLPNSCQ